MKPEPEPVSDSDSMGNYLVYSGLDTAYQTVLAYYEFAEMDIPPIDSSFFPSLRVPHLTTDNIGGKYLVAEHQTEFRVYFSTKDVLSSVPPTYEREGFQLEQNFPNPFNGSTRIRFSLTNPSKVTLRIFNLLGQEVELLLQEPLLPGWHEVEWIPRGIGSGVLFCRLDIVSDTRTWSRHTRKIVYLK